MAAISKYFEINLDSKITKPLKDKSFVCFDTDSIMIRAIIAEDFEDKIIEECQISVIYDYGTHIVEQRMQDGGIEIVGANEINIVPRGNCLVEAQMVTISINIYDEDEFITIQPFMFRILKSNESEMMDEVQDIPKTTIVLEGQIKELEDKIDNAGKDISDKIVAIEGQVKGFSYELEDEIEFMHELIDANVENMRDEIYATNSELNNLVNEEVLITRNEITRLRQDAINNIEELTERVNNTAIELDECFLRTIPLFPMDSNGKVLFSTERILGSPLDLIGKTYILNVTGSPANSNTISTNLSLLYFTLESGNVVINYVLLANKSIQGRNITITPQFDNGRNSIDSSTEEFNIRIMTNLLTSYAENAICTLSANSTFDNKL